MTTVDTFGAYVSSRLKAWGREFALCRDVEWLGFASKSVLAVIMESGGQLAGRSSGYKPLDVSPEAMEIESLISDMARDQPRQACALRAFYCGSGRKKVERYETAVMLIANLERDIKPRPAPPGLKRYLSLVDCGVAQIRGELQALARAA